MTGQTDGKQATWQSLKEREVVIWGAGQQGRGMCRVLERQGVRVRGFIDSNPALHGARALGYPIAAPSSITEGAERCFVIIASMLYDEAIKEQCRSLGLVEYADFLSYKELKPLDYAIDISGGCNLRCISCPRASRHQRHPPVGFMDAATFEKVLDKILREDPLVGSVQLYQWGEPLLNPQLPEILRIANSRGVPCAVSSNLSMDVDLGPVIKAGPAWFRVSISGTGPGYEKTHSGGNWQRLLTNLRALSSLRTELRPDMKTEVFYHLYKHNQGKEFTQARDLCRELGFEFHPVWAYLISLDDVLEHLEGGELSKEAQGASQLLALELEDGMALARAEANEPCVVDRCICVNWNLSVSNCLMFFYPEGNVAAENFLETPLSEIRKRRASCTLCKRCRSKALHRYCSVYITKPVERMAGER